MAPLTANGKKCIFIPCNRRKFTHRVFNSEGRLTAVLNRLKFFFCTTGGLLHSIPSSEEKDETESKIKSALKECVHETTRGGREVAINTLSEILFSYMKHIGWQSERVAQLSRPGNAQPQLCTRWVDFWDINPVKVTWNTSLMSLFILWHFWSLFNNNFYEFLMVILLSGKTRRNPVGWGTVDNCFLKNGVGNISWCDIFLSCTAASISFIT